MATTPIKVDPTRVGVVAKANVPVIAVNPATGKTQSFDLAELDDVSAVAWLNQIKDWKKKLEYRKLLAQIKVGRA